MSLSGFINIAAQPDVIFKNTNVNDMVIYTQSNSQKMILGVNSNTIGNIILSSNLTSINGGMTLNSQLKMSGLVIGGTDTGIVANSFTYVNCVPGYSNSLTSNLFYVSSNNINTNFYYQGGNNIISTLTGAGNLTIGSANMPAATIDIYGTTIHRSNVMFSNNTIGYVTLSNNGGTLYINSNITTSNLISSSITTSNLIVSTIITASNLNISGNVTGNIIGNIKGNLYGNINSNTTVDGNLIIARDTLFSNISPTINYTSFNPNTFQCETFSLTHTTDNINSPSSFPLPIKGGSMFMVYTFVQGIGSHVGMFLLNAALDNNYKEIMNNNSPYCGSTYYSSGIILYKSGGLGVNAIDQSYIIDIKYIPIA